jgi:NADPH2:quinone reductase
MPPLTNMRIALSDQLGVPPQIKSVPVPVLHPGEVLVRIEASGVNPLDLKILAGAAPHARHPLPAVLGVDLAGRIESVGPDVHHLQVGDAVYGLAGGVGGIQGSLAEFAAVDAALLARRPSQLTAREAAALPLIAITSWEGLIDHAHAQLGQHVLIHGGAGGVGHLAIQLAVARGARVSATGSAGDASLIEQFGASFIDYRVEPVADYVSRLTGGAGFDVVYDTVGGSTLDASFIAVRRGGHVVSSLGWGTHALAPLSLRAATYSGVFTLLPLLTGEGRAHHAHILTQVAAMVAEGTLRPRVDAREFSLATVNEAYRLLEQRAAKGKVVIGVAS